MATNEEDQSLVPRPSAALQKVSVSLVTRGLNDLLAARQSWQMKGSLFPGKRNRLTISHDGRVATHELNPHTQGSETAAGPGHRVEVFDIESSSEPTVLHGLGVPIWR